MPAVAPVPASAPMPACVPAAATVPAPTPAHRPVPVASVAFPVASSVRSKAQERLQQVKSTTQQTAKKNVGSFLIKPSDKFHIGNHGILL